VTFYRDDPQRGTIERKITDIPVRVGAIVPIDPTMLGLTGIGAAVAGIFTGGMPRGKGDIGGLLKFGFSVFQAGRAAVEGLSGALQRTTEIGESAVPALMMQPIYFQFYPESISDDRALHYEKHEIPLLSNPVPSLSGPSERKISFRLMFSQEKWQNEGVPLDDWDKYNFDVALALQAFRSFTYPIGTTLPQPVRLVLPGTRIGIDTDSVTGLIDKYSITYQAFFPDGQPRLAQLDVDFSEYPIAQGTVFTTRGDFMSVYGTYVTKQNGAIADRGSKTEPFGVTKRLDVSRSVR
jgi:hypothetical protein